MPNGCFVDTNVLLYLKDPNEPVKRAKARAWLDALVDRTQIVISPQVMNEFAHSIIKKFPHVGDAELVENLEAMRPWCTALMTSETALQGLAIHRRFAFSFYDSTLVSAAAISGCDVFLSEDLGHGSHVGSLQVINPFLVDPLSFLERH